MTKEAEAHAEEDRIKKEKIEAKNNADSLIFTAEKSLADAKDKVPADVKSEVEGKISDLKGVLETGTKEEIETKTKELSETLSKVGQSMYGSGQPGQQADATGATGGQEEPQAEEAKKSEEPVEGEVVN